MKTNYMNSKQKLFAITLTVATIISVAWINPAKIERQNKSLQSKENGKAVDHTVRPELTDTTKKKSRKIVRRKVKTSKSGKVISVVIDTITADPALLSFDNLSGPDIKLNLKTASDSLLSINMVNKINTLSTSSQKLVMNPMVNISAKELQKIQIAIQKNGQQLQKEFNSPAYKAKMLKYTKDLQAKYDTPEERAKLKALTSVVLAQANSPEQKLNWQASEQSNNKGEVIQFTEHKLTNVEIAKTKELLNLSFPQNMDKEITIKLDEKTTASGNTKIKMGLQNVRIHGRDDAANQLKQSPEYIELKKKFDKDVADLANKKIKKADQ